MTFKREYPKLVKWIEDTYADGFRTRDAMERLIRERNTGKSQGHILRQQRAALNWWFDEQYVPEGFRKVRFNIKGHEIRRIRDIKTGQFGFTVYQHGDEDDEARDEYERKVTERERRRKERKDV
jgi:hypothetical protein